MGDIAGLYDETRKSVSDLVSSLGVDELDRPVPATPGWTVKDVVAHLAGEVTCAIKGDFPREFFASIGDPPGVVKLNDWTARMVAERSERPLDELLDEWAFGTQELLPMLRGETARPEGIPQFADRVLVTDLGVHQQDINGALGLVRDRESSALRVGMSSLVAMAGMRLGGLAPLQVRTEEKGYVAGQGEPGATVSATRFELFRALSGRRNPDQIRSYDWDGEPEPYIPMFYPYGPREEPLVE
jgi:uncharacterized protein (TIGR03083 family)